MPNGRSSYGVDAEPKERRGLPRPPRGLWEQAEPGREVMKVAAVHPEEASRSRHVVTGLHQCAANELALVIPGARRRGEVLRDGDQHVEMDGRPCCRSYIDDV